MADEANDQMDETTLVVSPDAVAGSEPAAVATQEPERRAAPRICWGVRFATNRVQGAAAIHDLSMTGMRLFTSAHVTEGEQIELQFRPVRGAVPLRIQARVARLTEDGFAVEFQALEKYAAELLSAAIEKVAALVACFSGEPIDQ